MENDVVIAYDANKNVSAMEMVPWFGDGNPLANL